MTDMSAQYSAAIDAMLAAAQAWKQQHPNADLRFKPLLYPGSIYSARVPPGVPPDKVVIIADLSAVIAEVAGNEVTASLLRAMDEVATQGGASVLMAEAVIEYVFGIQCFARVERKDIEA